MRASGLLPLALPDRRGTVVGSQAAYTSGCCGTARFELGEDFFNEIIQHPVPLDMNTLKAMKRSSLGLDLYLWVTLTGPLPCQASSYGSPGGQVYRQFGA